MLFFLVIVYFHKIFKKTYSQLFGVQIEIQIFRLVSESRLNFSMFFCEKTLWNGESTQKKKKKQNYKLLWGFHHIFTTSSTQNKKTNIGGNVFTTSEQGGKHYKDRSNPKPKKTTVPNPLTPTPKILGPTGRPFFEEF